MKQYRVVVTLAAALAAGLAPAQDAEGPVRVLVSAVHERGEIVYRYQIENESLSAID